MPWLGGWWLPGTVRLTFKLVPVSFRFVVDIVALTHDSLKVLLFSPVSAIPPMLHTHHHHHHHHHKTTLIRRTRGQSRGSFEQSDAISGTGLHWTANSCHLVSSDTAPYTATYSKPSLGTKLGQQSFPQPVRCSCATDQPSNIRSTAQNTTILTAQFCTSSYHFLPDRHIPLICLLAYLHSMSVVHLSLYPP